MLCHGSSGQDQMVTGGSAGSDSQGSEGAEVNLLRFSVKGEEDQNAAWLSLYIFNKERYKNNKRNLKNRNSPIWCKQTQRQEQSPTKHSKNMAA